MGAGGMAIDWVGGAMEPEEAAVAEEEEEEGACTCEAGEVEEGVEPVPDAR